MTVIITSEGLCEKQADEQKNVKEKRGGMMLRKVLKKAWRERRKGGEAETREGVLLMISPPAVGLGWSNRMEGGGSGRGRGNKMGFEILLMGGKKKKVGEGSV